MAKAQAKFSVIFDPENGLQLHNLDTNEVADLAVLEGTWRKKGAPMPEVEGKAEAPEVKRLSAKAGIPIRKYGSLRIRSANRMSYDQITSSAKGRMSYDQITSSAKGRMSHDQITSSAKKKSR